MTQDLADVTGGALARTYRDRKASPVEVTQAVLRRVERLNPRYNAFCLIDPSARFCGRAAAEARWSKEELLSDIDGVPTTIKDPILNPRIGRPCAAPHSIDPRRHSNGTRMRWRWRGCANPGGGDFKSRRRADAGVWLEKSAINL